MNMWWGYKHTNGSYQVKRYFGKTSMALDVQSDFVKWHFGPFEAENRADALRQLGAENERKKS